jgi:hypothetical protein
VEQTLFYNLTALVLTQPNMTAFVSATQQYVYGSIYTHVYHVNKGEGLPKHEHTYRHGVICPQGSCVIRKENLELVINKTSNFVDLKENEWHELEALEDNTIIINIW